MPRAADRRRSSVASREAKASKLARERDEALEQLSAASDVLKVISSSPGDLAPVFDAMLEKATRLCRAGFGTLWIYDGERFNVAAIHAVPAALAEFVREPVPVAASASLVDIVCGQNLVHVPDLAATELYRAGNRVRHAYVDLGGARTLVSVALRRDNALLGAFNVYRQEVRPFSDKEIALVQNFAGQAVIAIENARLLTEQREALERQTATAEVLQVINSSPGSLAPVFEMILEKAHSLCGVSHGSLQLYDGETFRAVAVHSLSEALAQRLRQGFVPGSNHPSQPLLQGARFAQSLDLAEINDPLARAAFELSGIRTVLLIPLRKEDKLIGQIVAARQEVRPFTEKEIALLENFAAQAVIAMENARLITETREALEQQTATAEVLQVINSSPGDLAPVFEAMLEKAMRLCEATFGGLTSYDGERFHTLALRGLPREAAEVFRDPWTAGPGSYHENLVCGQPLVHTDLAADEDAVRRAHPQTRAVLEICGARTGLLIALRKDDALLGSLWFYRKEVRPFSDKQIALLENFAAQAVIAIENARLLGELRERQAELRTTFDNMGDGVAMFDAAARLAAWNRNFQEMLDLPETLLAERPSLAELFRYLAARGEFGSADLEAQLSRSLGDTRQEMRYERTRPDGRVIEVRRNPVPDGGFVLIYADITERKRAEEAIRAARDAAETAFRELQTAQDRLVQTQKLASLGQLTAGIAHEIKNPLNFVNNFSSLSVELIDELQEALGRVLVDKGTQTEVTELADTLRDNLCKIVQHGKRADSIVKNMLLHAREGSGEHRPVDINALVEESLNLAYHGARAEKQGFSITLRRSFDPTAGQADVFPQDITRVLLNLISNGFDAVAKRKSEAGAGDFEPMLAAATRNLGDRVEIKIRDNGTGIPPDVKEKMFNPFFTTKPAGEGTGLGLSISHDIIVKQHAGSIEFDTRLGEFTEIRIILPRASAFPA
jgi:PAS domain S-box-containing protein